MTSHPYRPLRIPRGADMAAVAAAQRAHADAQAASACPQCHVARGRPCRGTGGQHGHGYTHVARRALTTGATT